MSSSSTAGSGTPPPPRGDQTPSPALQLSQPPQMQSSIQPPHQPPTTAPSIPQQHTPPPSSTPAASPPGMSASPPASALVLPQPPEQTASSHPAFPLHPSPPALASGHSSSAQSNDDDLSHVQLRRTDTQMSARVRHYLKRETSLFFGVCQDEEREQRRLWRERRRRHAARCLGPIKANAPDTDDEDVDSSRMGVMTFASGRPDVLPGGEPVTSRVGGDVSSSAAPARGKDSVARLTMTGLSYVVAAMTRSRARASAPPRTWSRSFPASEVVRPADLEQDEGDDDVFFAPSPRQFEDSDGGKDVADGFTGAAEEGVEWRRGAGDVPRAARAGRVSWGAAPAAAAASRISPTLLDAVADNSNRRQYGMGVVGRLFRRSMRQSVSRREDVARQLDAITDYRPYFTWWVSVVQLLVLILSIACYGFGPVGFGRASKSGQVLVTSLSLQQVDYQEPAGFWLGPRAADLIHVGAKFAACMRKDARISRDIAAGARRERDTACCIRNDDSGCVQSSQADCSNTISTWKKWSAGAQGPGGRISGSVCGLDPKFCEAPASVAPYEWPDDITKWPICRKSSVRGAIRGAGSSSSSASLSTGGGVTRRLDKAAEHMACEVIGHPCCIGVYGHCRITTREYCDFVRGYFHEEASLCSQVSCLDDVCGMLPFMVKGRPDQFYRLWTSLFVHAGILHLAFTLALQWLLMRDLEKLAGPLRVAVIYLGSGLAGNLASAIFMPYRAEVGPAGAHFGLLACLLAEVAHSWRLLRYPQRSAARLLSIAGALFVIGLLPWIDNYAHLFGFVFGFLLSYALLPYVTFGPYDRRKKVVLIWTCLISAGVLFALLVILFYVVPVYDCEWCSYFNCIPFTEDFCSSQNINFKREETVV